jgi:putative hydrolase of the HAD superfamily
MPPHFIYFDMGNVLLRFSHERQAAQMAQITGVSADRVWQILFDEGLHWSYERGELTPEQFYSEFCEMVGASLDRARLDHAANDIFELNVPIVALVGQIAKAGYRLGILSNTTATHWQYCTSRFGVLTSVFRVHALSFRIGAMKPDARIFAAAAKLAAVPPADIFFADDRPDHVASARSMGFDAVVYESVALLNEELRRRGVVLNY